MKIKSSSGNAAFSALGCFAIGAGAASVSRFGNLRNGFTDMLGASGIVVGVSSYSGSSYAYSLRIIRRERFSTGS